MNSKAIVLVLAGLIPCLAHAQDSTNVKKVPQIGGTIRAKYEYQTSEGEGRFEVRNARINVTGDITLPFHTTQRLISATRVPSRCWMPTLE